MPAALVRLLIGTLALAVIPALAAPVTCAPGSGNPFFFQLPMCTSPGGVSTTTLLDLNSGNYFDVIPNYPGMASKSLFAPPPTGTNCHVMAGGEYCYFDDTVHNPGSGGWILEIKVRNLEAFPVTFDLRTPREGLSSWGLPIGYEGQLHLLPSSTAYFASSVTSEYQWPETGSGRFFEVLNKTGYDLHFDASIVEASPGNSLFYGVHQYVLQSSGDWFIEGPTTTPAYLQVTIPEPTSVVLIGCGMFLMALGRLRRMRG